MPFDIPDSWEWVRLEDICEINLGLTHTPSYVEDGIPFVSAKDISSSLLDLTNTKRISKSEFATFPYGAKPHEGDVLFCRVGTIGHPQIVITEEPFGIFVSVGFLRITNKDISNKYLKYWMESPLFYNQVESDVKGATRKNLNTGWLKDFYIPIPPLNEQVRIVRSIQSYFALLYEIEAHKSDLQDYIKTTKSKVLDLAIHGKLVPQDPNDEPAIELLKRINPAFKTCDTSHYENLPETWCVAHMGEVYNHTTGKALKKVDMTGELRQYITTSNVYWNSFDFTEVRSMYFTEKELDKCTAHKGDLLVCNGGDVGRAAIWDYDYDICYQNHISRLRPKSADIVFNPFYSYLFRYFKDKGQLNGKGVAITSLSAADIQSLAIPVPPLAEQKRIVKRIDTIFAQLDTITAEL